jgi:hypothetical protein
VLKSSDFGVRPRSSNLERASAPELMALLNLDEYSIENSPLAVVMFCSFAAHPASRTEFIFFVGLVKAVRPL